MQQIGEMIKRQKAILRTLTKLHAHAWFPDFLEMLWAKVSYSSNGQHTFYSDPKAHLTLDVYGEEDKPIGVMHVYPPAKGDKGSLKLFSSPRKKALDVSFLQRTCLQQWPDWFFRRGESIKLPLESRLDSICDTINCRFWRIVRC